MNSRKNQQKKRSISDLEKIIVAGNERLVKDIEMMVKNEVKTVRTMMDKKISRLELNITVNNMTMNARMTNIENDQIRTKQMINGLRQDN